MKPCQNRKNDFEKTSNDERLRAPGDTKCRVPRKAALVWQTCRTARAPRARDATRDATTRAITVKPAKSMVFEGPRRGVTPQGSGSGLQDMTGTPEPASMRTATKESERPPQTSRTSVCLHHSVGTEKVSRRCCATFLPNMSERLGVKT